MSSNNQAKFPKTLKNLKKLLRNSRLAKKLFILTAGLETLLTNPRKKNFPVFWLILSSSF